MKACKLTVNASETDLPRIAAIVSCIVSTNVPLKSVRPELWFFARSYRLDRQIQHVTRY
jgi:hypothetical protein